MSKKTKKIIAGVIGAGILVAMIAFFSYYKVDSVEVRGTSHYTDEEVKKMVLRGPLASNSVLAPLFYSTTKTDDIIYVDAFKVTQLNRSTICISVKEKKIVGCIKYLDSYIYFDRNGIFVEGSQTRDETVPYFDGIQVNKIVMDEKLDIKGDTVLNTAVALSTIFQKNDMIPDHIQFDSSYSISLIYGDITVQLGKDENLEEKMNRVIAIMPKIQGKKGILHMESVSTDTNTFEEEKEEQDNTEITAENWNGGYNEDGDYTGDGEYDENGNYVGAKPKTALEEAIENWNGGYDGEGDYTGAGEYDADGNYVGPKPTQESLDAAAQENSDSSGTEDQSADTSGDSWEEDSGSYDTGYGNDSSDSSDQYDEYGNYIGDGGDYYGDEEY
ncbi:MAG: cell division protein FtsQ/DivIB [Blautia sp.]|uniref:cell division protein FtsQ/DivIB n=1 Tax=Blautia sp. TaxID=1955243 RepID=UPI0025BBF5B7|nr:cell division protein FtsQ/DivIB [Blautia sp.]MCI6302436.1 cell division protein FtsQ/DivIB [Blautia sp.]